jgi:hypothetical protein
MITINDKILEISREILNKAINNAVCKPIDRHTILTFLSNILELTYHEKQAFIIHNFEKYPRNYSVRFMTCIPELWEDLDYEKLMELIKLSSTSQKTVKRFIEFSYKFLQINTFPFFRSEVQPILWRETQEYFLKNVRLLIRDDIDESELFYNDKIMGIQLDRFCPITNKLLGDSRISGTLGDANTIKEYIKSLN